MLKAEEWTFMMEWVSLRLYSSLVLRGRFKIATRHDNFIYPLFQSHSQTSAISVYLSSHPERLMAIPSSCLLHFGTETHSTWAMINRALEGKAKAKWRGEIIKGWAARDRKVCFIILIKHTFLILILIISKLLMAARLLLRLIL